MTNDITRLTTVLTGQEFPAGKIGLSGWYTCRHTQTHLKKFMRLFFTIDTKYT